MTAVIRIGAEAGPGDTPGGRYAQRRKTATAEERLPALIIPWRQASRCWIPAQERLTVPTAACRRRCLFQPRSRSTHSSPARANEPSRVRCSARQKTAGDKHLRRHGNKGVACKVRLLEDMPYMADGTPGRPFSTLGVPSFFV